MRWRRHSTTRAIAKTVAIAVALSFLAGCATPEAGEQALQMRLDQRGHELDLFLATPVADTPVDSKALVVRLAFGPEADLDLYVTDPRLETVYFANHKAKSGGQISADRRCGGKTLQSEYVRFDAPIPGRYRVGIDYPESCDGTKGPVAHALSVVYNGKRLEVQGSVSLQQFEVIVLEFDIDAKDMKEVTK